jgi:hypothetical protein
MKVGDLVRVKFTKSYFGFVTKVYEHGFEIWYLDGPRRVYDVGDGFEFEVISEGR